MATALSGSALDSTALRDSLGAALLHQHPALRALLETTAEALARNALAEALEAPSRRAGAAGAPAGGAERSLLSVAVAEAMSGAARPRQGAGGAGLDSSAAVSVPFEVEAVARHKARAAVLARAADRLQAPCRLVAEVASPRDTPRAVVAAAGQLGARLALDRLGDLLNAALPAAVAAEAAAQAASADAASPLERLWLEGRVEEAAAWLQRAGPLKALGELQSLVRAYSGIAQAQHRSLARLLVSAGLRPATVTRLADAAAVAIHSAAPGGAVAIHLALVSELRAPQAALARIADEPGGAADTAAEGEPEDEVDAAAGVAKAELAALLLERLAAWSAAATSAGDAAGPQALASEVGCVRVGDWSASLLAL